LIVSEPKSTDVFLASKVAFRDVPLSQLLRGKGREPVNPLSIPTASVGKEADHEDEEIHVGPSVAEGDKIVEVSADAGPEIVIRDGVADAEGERERCDGEVGVGFYGDGSDDAECRAAAATQSPEEIRVAGW
jgi:hypothetical protein